MGGLRIPEGIFSRTHRHLLDDGNEHFAFLFARVVAAVAGPTFVVRDALLVPSHQVLFGRGGLEVATEVLLDAINACVRSGDALIECHSHGGRRPGFSRTDRIGLAEMIPYALESLPGRPYGATVWGDDRVYGEWAANDGRAGKLDSMLVVGQQLRQLAGGDEDMADPRYERQLPWFSTTGQADLARLRVAICGCGGTGSQLAQQLAYLGCRRFVLVDPDTADRSNLNRLVTATADDLGRGKAELAAAMIMRIAPDAEVEKVPIRLESQRALDALKSADVIFGCVDNDGARLILNELALAYVVPLIDLAVGIAIESGRVVEAGGRIALVGADGPCLQCLGEIDRNEAAYFLASAEEQKVARARGYVTGMDAPAPAVISLNAAIVAAAVSEFAIWVSGVRAPQSLTELDLLGRGRAMPGQWLAPRRGTRVDPRCVQCALRGRADRVGIDRYASLRTPG
jgi:molybdopterin/thiamine biosynthesis adenylyltransferase